MAAGTEDPGTGRRAFLRGALGAGVTGAVAGAAGGYAYRASQPASASAVALQSAQAGMLPPVPFHGRYQAGILPAPQRQTAVVAFNATADGRGELVELFQTITARARFLTAGGIPPPVGIGAPPSDSGVLGPSVVPDGLTVTLGVGSTLFDDRYGLAAPARLTPMRPFPDDDLDPAQCGGDLVLQLSAGNADTVLHALRDIAKHTRGGMQALWRIDGFASPGRPAGTVPRNMLGFMDGRHLQPRHRGSRPDGQPDLDPARHRGRAVLDRRRELLRGAADQDAAGVLGPGGHHRAVIPLTAHMRLANPRAPQSASSRILRRAYNYDRGLDQVGDLDVGLVFSCFQQDIRRQFEAVQTRLIGEPLVDYISPFGGGYFLALPGVVDGSDYLGRAMLA